MVQFQAGRFNVQVLFGFELVKAAELEKEEQTLAAVLVQRALTVQGCLSTKNFVNLLFVDTLQKLSP